VFPAYQILPNQTNCCGIFVDVTAQLRTENRNLQHQYESSCKMIEQFQDFIREQLPASVATFFEDCQEKTKVPPMIFEQQFCVIAEYCKRTSLEQPISLQKYSYRRRVI